MVSGSVQYRKRRDGKRIYSMMIRINGTQKRERIGKVTLYEAKECLRKRLEEIQKNFSRDLKKATFAELAKEWLESQKLDKKPKTLKNYTTQTNHDLIPFFGKMVVSKILPEHIERFKREISPRKIMKTVVKMVDGVKIKERVEIRKDLSTVSINYDLRILRQILEAGTRWGFLYSNPGKLVKSLKEKRKEFKALAKEDVTELLKAAEKLPYSIRYEKADVEIPLHVPGQPKTLLMTAVCTALRQGEILGMRWKHLNFETGTYTVKEAYSAENGFDSPKTGPSLRSILLPQVLLQELRAHRIRQNEFRLQSGGKWQDEGLVFTSLVGGPVDAHTMRRRIFEKVLKLAKLPHVRFHDLRGTAATLALQAGASIKEVQNLLGHSTAKLTLELYAKTSEAGKRDLADKMEAYLFG